MENGTPNDLTDVLLDNGPTAPPASTGPVDSLPGYSTTSDPNDVTNVPFDNEPPAAPASKGSVDPPPAYSTNEGHALNVHQQPKIVLQPIMFGTDPINMACNNCGNQITTSVATDPGTMAYVLAGVICLLGFWCGCCLIPLGVDSLQDAVHTCPRCKVILGKHKA
eukprot:TRINITY_DN23645_c0_g1_i1.p1 TRINITY_DN23645_c0_g1~~TRINITY_DN23645_c0_g1_i1.p1  ORF type:complete len:165 (-),score=15.15 TRINITY_DN23645_c0_g1_i1:280-774(-)